MTLERPADQVQRTFVEDGIVVPSRPRAFVLLTAVIVVLAAFQISLRSGDRSDLALGDALIWLPPLNDWGQLEGGRLDAIQSYHRDLLPTGVRALFRLLSPLADAGVLSTWLSIPLYAATLLGIGIAVRRLAGNTAALAAILLALSSSIFVARSEVGLPRSFAFPILALMAAALVTGRMRQLAFLVVLGALFYPIAGVIGGIALALVLLCLPASRRGDARSWSPGRRLLWIGAVVALSAAAILPQQISSSAWGPLIRADQASEFPEIGRGGRYQANNRAPFGSFLVPAERAARHTMLSERQAWNAPVGAGDLDHPEGRILLRAIVSLLAVTAFLLAVRNASLARLLSLLVAAAVGYYVSVPLTPLFFLPPRFATYPTPVILVILWCSLPWILVSKWNAKIALAGGPILVAFWLVLFGWVDRDSKESRSVTPAERRLVSFAATTPIAARFAGFPTGPVELLPLHAKRSILIGYETHQAYHRRYVLLMRDRMSALIRALFASDAADVRRLGDLYGVRYLIVDRRDFRAPPEYFRPFDSDIAARWQEGMKAGFVLPKIAGKALVFSIGPYQVLDLNRLVHRKRSPHSAARVRRADPRPTGAR